MKLKYFPLGWSLVISCCVFDVKTQEDNQNAPSDCPNIPDKILIDPKDLKTIDPNSSVLVLVPSGWNLTESMLNNENFNLFKLNTDRILNKNSGTQEEKIDDTSDTTSDQEDEVNPRTSRELDFERRNARRFNLLRGLWNRSRSGPLYLVNGTVCRFVNATPICTTLSTSGLIRPGAGGSGGSSSGGGGGASGSGGGGARPPAASGVQSSGSSVQFVDQSLNQRPRPAAVMDDDSQDINVENLNTSTEDTRVVRNQQQQQPLLPQQTSPQPILPTNYVVNRRPINLLAPFRRPVRQFMISSERASGRAQNRLEQEALHGKVKRQTHLETRGD